MMPLHLKKIEPDFQLGVWKMDEEPEELLSGFELSPADIEKVNSFQHAPRRKEWICIRLLLKKLNRDFSIGYESNGKPFPDGAAAHLSISHTKDFAGIMVSDQYPVGVDFERIHPRIGNIAHKFVSSGEESFLPVQDRLETLFVLWGVKEVLFKIHSIGDLLFKEHIAVEPFSFTPQGDVHASVTKPGFEKKYSLHYELHGDLLMTYCLDKG